MRLPHKVHLWQVPSGAPSGDVHEEASRPGVGRDDGCGVFPGQQASRDQVVFGALLGNKQFCRAIGTVQFILH